MRLDYLRHLAGPNVFTGKPVTVARLELEELTGAETTSFSRFADELLTALPGLRGHHCAAGRPGGFVDAMARGTYFGHVAEHVALELSGLAGRTVHLGRTMWAGADGRYDVMMECPRDEPADSEVPRRLLATSLRIIDELMAGQRPDFSADLRQIARIAERERLGVSTAAIAAAARRRGIPVRRVGSLSMLRLGYGCHRRLVCAALTEQTSALGVDIASDKVLAKQLLAAAGIPVPDGVVVGSAAEAVAALSELGAPVVIKPHSGNQGANITIGVTSPEAAAASYEQASAAGPAVIVEKFVPGTDYRVLVIDGRVVAAAELRPAAVTGDGSHSIIQLVAEANADPRRGDGHARELTRITLDDAAIAHLAERGLDGHSVPASGELVTLRRNANLSTGGTSRDVTDDVHGDVADMCRRAADVAGLDICGIDIRLADISAPLVELGYHGEARTSAVIELNASPGLRMHLSPSEGTGRDVAGAVVDRLYPPGAPSRIPLIAVTGTNGKTTTVRMIGHILRQAGMRVGMSTTDGVYSGGRMIYDADASGPRSAEMVLDDTSIEAAVLETARGGIIRRGLGYDRADVAVITNISADHLGTDGIDDLDELVHVKALIAEEIAVGGTVVLNADDPVTAALADRPAVRRNAPVIRYFSLKQDNPLVERHRLAGGISCEIRDGQLTEVEDGRERVLISVAELPGAFGGRAPHVVANALAAVAACRAVGVSAKDIKRALATFAPGEANPGRGNIYSAGGCPVIVDYGHNAAALDATGQMISNVWPGQACAAVTLPGDRRDDLVTETAEAIAAWFSHVVVYEDCDRRGRRPGEMRELITAAMRRVRPDLVCEQAEGPQAALRTAVSLAGGGPVLFLYEKLALAHSALDAIGAEPWPAAATMASADDDSAQTAHVAGVAEPMGGPVVVPVPSALRGPPAATAPPVLAGAAASPDQGAGPVAQAAGPPASRPSPEASGGAQGSDRPRGEPATGQADQNRSRTTVAAPRPPVMPAQRTAADQVRPASTVQPAPPASGPADQAARPGADKPAQQAIPAAGPPAGEQASSGPAASNDRGSEPAGPAAQHAACSPLTRADRDEQWNRGHW
ncbi:MAG TPA: cyanophycin synthetase [Streptosporangiaceae bacterium]